jgi:acyl dehydratase
MAPAMIESPQSLRDLVGREIAATEWLPVDQDRIQQFAAATGDQQWIHVEGERARRESPYGTTIAHGFLTLSLLSQLMQNALVIRSGVRLAINYGLNRVRFPSAVRAGSRIRARFTVQSVKDLPDCVEAVFLVVVEGENTEKPCCVAEWIVRYYA